MKLRELRIGNWYISKGVGAEIRWRIDNKDDFYHMAEHLGEFKPILLSPQGLKKVGFKYNPGGLELYCNGLTIVAEIEDDNIVSFMLEGTFIEIEYFHRLQNLYFVLTGKELKIKQ